MLVNIFVNVHLHIRNGDEGLVLTHSHILYTRGNCFLFDIRNYMSYEIYSNYIIILFFCNRRYMDDVHVYSYIRICSYRHDQHVSSVCYRRIVCVKRNVLII